MEDEKKNNMMIFVVILVAVIIVAAGIIIVLSGGSSDDTEEMNEVPVAVAPEDHTLQSGEESMLDGDSSFDPDGDELQFFWDLDAEVDSDGDGITDNDLDMSGETVTYTAPVIDETTTFIVTLIVTDGMDNSSDITRITVESEGPMEAPDIEFTLTYGDPIGLLADPHYILTVDTASRLEPIMNYSYQILDDNDDIVLSGVIDELLMAGVNESVRYVDIDTSIEGLDMVSEGDSVLIRDTAPVQEGMTFHLYYNGEEAGMMALLREIVP